jgi:tetratricopeptide (TPR) repeat protein
MMRTARALKKPWPGALCLGLLALAAPGALGPRTPWGGAAAQAACPDARALETRLRGAPGDLALTLNLGRAYLCAGRYRDAQLAFEDAVALDYRAFDAHFYLGRALFEQGSLDAALFEYTQLSSLYPDRLEPLYNRGVVLARLKKPDDAIAAFRAAIEAGRKSNAPQANIVDAYVGLAAQQRAKNDAAGAAQTYAEALEVRAGDPALTLGRAQALLDAGRGPEALPLAYEISRQEPGQPRRHPAGRGRLRGPGPARPGGPGDRPGARGGEGRARALEPLPAPRPGAAKGGPQGRRGRVLPRGGRGEPRVVGGPVQPRRQPARLEAC